ncbi:N-glycosylase/DNA lyase [Tachysurus vachellii]|uniref:N-glycosylase/DNA lyase n=1 Tax=Tachysurus vachellii TaxID=175792 RepID=UPI00296A9439|nr:N-glycosylase/DNA lyase [Tachysurus vachellii]
MSQHALLSLGATAWRCLSCPKSELRLDLTLGCGQTFRWHETGEGHWTGVMGGRVWTLTQTNDTLWYHVYRRQEDPGNADGRKRKAENSQESGKRFKEMTKVKVEENEKSLCVSNSEQDAKDEEMLRDYFQLSVNLEDLYKEWGDADRHFRLIGNIFSGVRMLRQDPVECLFSFICSSNNHISRIQGMVERLCGTLGTALCQLDGTQYHDFPSIEALAERSVEAQLRDLGFGYRARFLQGSAHLIMSSHGPKWLHDLRNIPYLEARAALLTLPGVGPKVADCVCLMSLDKSEAVPVDTHVWQIVRRDYSCAAGTKQKTLTNKVYKEIGDFFRKLWGSYAGWAHSVLFCADLKKFQQLKEIPTIKEEKNQAKQVVKKKNTICQKAGNVKKKGD